MLADRPWGWRPLARLVFAIDERLRLQNGVFDYVRHSDCIFRAKIDAVTEAICLPDGVGLRPGDRILELHFRNEHFPKMDAKGATIGWAIRTTKLLDLSLRELAEFLDRRPEFDDIAVVRAIMPVRGASQAGQFERIAVRLGFNLAPTPPPQGLERLRNLGQNAFALLLVLAGNPNAARPGILWRRGVSAFLSRQAMNQRYLERALRVPSESRQ